MTWTDSVLLAEHLERRMPDVDPLTIRFPDLIRWVQSLDGFAGASKPESAQLLEEIQRAWYAHTQGR